MLAQHSSLFAMNALNPQQMKNYTVWKCHASANMNFAVLNAEREIFDMETEK